MLACALEENLQRKPMTCLEEAEAYVELAQHGHRGDRVTATIAERVGKTQRHIQSYIALARDLSPEAKQALTEGRINIEHAKVLSGISAKDQERFIADHVGSKPLRTDRRVLKALLKPGAPAADLDKAQSASGDAGEALQQPVRSTQPTRRSKDPVRRYAESLRAAAIYQAFTSHPDVGLRIAALDLADQLDACTIDLERMKEAKTLLTLQSAVERWQLVSGLSAAKLRKLLVHLLASTIAPKLASLGRTPSLFGPACQALPLGKAAANQLDEAFLRRYPKAQLIDLAVASGAFSEERRPELQRRTPKELRAAILESETRNPEWLPAELRFDWSEPTAPSSPSSEPKPAIENVEETSR